MGLACDGPFYKSRCKELRATILRMNKELADEKHMCDRLADELVLYKGKNIDLLIEEYKQLRERDSH